MLTAAVLSLLCLYVFYPAIRYGVRHGMEGARPSGARESEQKVEQ